MLRYPQIEIKFLGVILLCVLCESVWFQGLLLLRFEGEINVQKMYFEIYELGNH